MADAPERLDQLSLVARHAAVEHVHLEAALRPDQRREQPNRSGARDEQFFRLPATRAGSDPLDVIPTLGQNASGLEQDAKNAEARVDLDGEFRLDAEVVGAVAVPLLDAALGVAAVAAHVPFAGGARRAGNRIGPPHHADHKVAGGKSAAARRLQDAAERLMAEHEARVAGRRLPVKSGDDLAIGAAHAKRESFGQNRAIAQRRFRHLVQSCGIGNSRLDRERAHRVSPSESVIWAQTRAVSPPRDYAGDREKFHCGAAAAAAMEPPHSDRRLTHFREKPVWRRAMDIGRKRWAIAEGYIPSQSSFSERALVSHETACILNASDRDAHIALTVFFASREPVS